MKKKKLSADRIAADLKKFVAGSYPDMQIQVGPWDQDPSRQAICFVDEKFGMLYPYHRWHYLNHLIPAEYQTAHLADTEWFELAPGEDPADLRFPDVELIDEIIPDVMNCVNRSGFIPALDDAMCPLDPTTPRAPCCGDFRLAKPLLLKHRFTEDELFDVLHVLMRQGGFCDCEILLNVAEESRLKAEYWKVRAAGLEPKGPHRST